MRPFDRAHHIRRESRSVRFQLFPINACCFPFLDSHFRGNDGSVATVTVRFRLCWNFGKLMNRHSRAGGNLVCSVSVISDKCLLLFISRFPLSWE
ncbi:hypothetical protein COH31_07100 [Neisseria meningitidis]|nr:hypothetical protein COH31_07100 [Neisseria meningitidis]